MYNSIESHTIIHFERPLALIRNSWFTILNHKAFHDKTTMHILYQSRHAQKSLFRVSREFSHLGRNSPPQTLIRKI